MLHVNYRVLEGPGSYFIYLWIGQDGLCVSLVYSLNATSLQSHRYERNILLLQYSNSNISVLSLLYAKTFTKMFSEYSEILCFELC